MNKKEFVGVLEKKIRQVRKQNSRIEQKMLLDAVGHPELDMLPYLSLNRYYLGIVAGLMVAIKEAKGV